MNRILLAIAISCFASTARAAPVRVLIAVGSNIGLPGEAPLEYAAEDARRFAAVFGAIGGVELDEISVITDQRPGAVLDALDRAGRSARKSSSEELTLIFYFSGHGDEESLHLSGDELRIEALLSAIERVPASLRLVILDSCRSAGEAAKGLKKGEGFAISVDRSPKSHGTLIVRSSSDGEAAQESEQLGGAVFTHYFMSALRGAADWDRDERVTFDEAYSFAYGRTVRRSAYARGLLQHPALDVRLEIAGPIVLTVTSQASARIVFPPGRDVEYLVFHLPSGSMVAEIWGRDAPLSLALPSGRFLVQRRSEGGYGALEVSLPYGGERAIDPSEFTALEPEVLAAKGGRFLVEHHRIWAGYGIGGSVLDRATHRAQLGYDYLTLDLVISAAAEIGRSAYTTPAYRVRESFAGASGHVDLRLPIGPGEARLGAGLGLRFIDQDLEHLDADRLRAAGYDSESQSRALGLGPLLFAGFDLPLVSDLWLGLGVRTLLLFHGAEEGSSARPILDGEVRVGLEL
jgi:hypothetical protein